MEIALNYFRVGGQRHNADEEESLFPRLCAECTHTETAEIDGLKGDHRRASQLHADVERLYRAWITERRLSEENEERLLAMTDQLRHLYEVHIQIEERSVFPHAAKVLTGDAVEAIGKEFRTRRQ